VQFVFWTSVYAAYNAVPGCATRMFNVVTSGHAHTPAMGEEMEGAILRHFAA
jgi:hypothetical protein